MVSCEKKSGGDFFFFTENWTQYAALRDRSW